MCMILIKFPNAPTKLENVRSATKGKMMPLILEYQRKRREKSTAQFIGRRWWQRQSQRHPEQYRAMKGSKGDKGADTR